MVKMKFRGLELEIKEKLTLEEANDFVNNVRTTVVRNNYLPLYYDLSLVIAFLNSYTNINEIDNDLSLDELYEDVEDFKSFVLKAKKIDKFDLTQYENIIDSCNKAIEFDKEKLSKTTALDNLINTINDVLVGINENIDFDLMKNILPKLSEFNINQENLVDQVLKSINGEHNANN